VNLLSILYSFIFSWCKDWFYFWYFQGKKRRTMCLFLEKVVSPCRLNER
jgi:hypothetical protein